MIIPPSDARWFTRQEVESVLDHKTGTTFRSADFKKMAEIIDGPNKASQLEPAAQALAPPDHTKPRPQYVPSNDEPPFRLPPLTAIAGVLIRDWIDRKIGFPVDENLIPKGNL